MAKLSVVRISVATAMLFFASMLCSCGMGPDGNSSNQAPPPTTASPLFGGNWQINFVSKKFGETYGSGGMLSSTDIPYQQSQASVTGILHIMSKCFVSSTNAIYDIPLNGTVNASGLLNLTSTAVASQVITIAGQVIAGPYSRLKYCSASFQSSQPSDLPIARH